MKQVVELILAGLKTQRFVDWYEGKFVPFIEGADENTPTEEEIKTQIERIFQVERNHLIGQASWTPMPAEYEPPQRLGKTISGIPLNLGVPLG